MQIFIDSTITVFRFDWHNFKIEMSLKIKIEITWITTSFMCHASQHFRFWFNMQTAYSRLDNVLTGENKSLCGWEIELLDHWIHH